MPEVSLYRYVPLALILFRLILGPTMLLVAWNMPGSGPWLALCLIPAILSDIFDGIIARRLNVATARLRRYDSQTDLVFWLSVLGCICLLHPRVVERNWYFLAIMLVLEVASYSLSYWRFGREPCTHAYSAKVWGLFLVACFGIVLAWGEEDYAVRVLFWSYLVSWVDVILIILLLPEWRHDVHSCWNAYKARTDHR
jgi:phosphatidylglycerophosphate synthase